MTADPIRRCSAGMATRVLRGVCLLVGIVLLAGCTAMGADGQARADQGYVPGEGTYSEFAVDERGDPIVVSGVDTSGEPLSSEDFRGQVVVLNLWYAACGPCREEAPDLKSIAEKKAADDVQFIGIDTRDDPATAASFERTFEMPYPSIVDQQGDAVLALRGVAPPNAVPTTIVLDRQGRVSARISGKINPSILNTLIDTAVQEQSA